MLKPGDPAPGSKEVVENDPLRAAKELSPPGLAVAH
jgi:hypothetical protein